MESTLEGGWIPLSDREDPMESTRREVWVDGVAHRRVLPDIAVVRVSVRTDRVATPQEALSAALAARERLRERIAFRLAGVDVSDTRITAEPQHAQRRVPEPVSPTFPAGGENQEWVVVGYEGVGAITLRASAARAAEMVMAVADHPDAHGVDPWFEMDPATDRQLRDELQCRALEDAHRRAARLAGVLAERVDRVTLIDAQEQSSSLYSAKMATMQGGGGEGGDTGVSELVPEPVDIEVSVRARFAMDPSE